MFSNFGKPRNIDRRPPWDLVSNERGFTLIELVIVLAIAFILALVVVPSFSQILRVNRVAAQVNMFVTAHRLARSEAIKSGRDTAVCASSDGDKCDDDNDWSPGWIVFTDANENGERDSGDALIRSWPALQGQTTLTSPDSKTVRYQPNGRTRESATFDLCNQTISRKLSIAKTGAAQLTESGAGC